MTEDDILAELKEITLRIDVILGCIIPKDKLSQIIESKRQ